MRRLLLMVLIGGVAAIEWTGPVASAAGPQAVEPTRPVVADLHANRRHPGTLSDDEVREIALETLRDCGLSAHTTRAAAPWYFHYELGLRLVEAGDLQRAVDALLDAAERRPLPDVQVRMYGMWFIDYRPYLEIAACHVALGNWECAFSALELSRATGEVDESTTDPSAVRYLDLVEETLARVGAE